MLGWRRDEKRFIEEILLRMERSERRTVAMFERIDKSLDRLNTKMDEQLRQTRQSREEYEAHRGTLLAILDRLDLIDPRDGPPHPSQA